MIAGFICQTYLFITSLHWRHSNNYASYENKCYNPRNQNHRIPVFVTHVCKFCLRTDASGDTPRAYLLNRST